MRVTRMVPPEGHLYFTATPRKDLTAGAAGFVQQMVSEFGNIVEDFTKVLGAKGLPLEDIDNELSRTILERIFGITSEYNPSRFNVHEKIREIESLRTNEPPTRVKR